MVSKNKKTPKIKHLKQFPKPDPSLLLIKKYMEQENKLNRLYNKILVPIQQEMNEKVLQGNVKKKDLVDYKNKKLKAIKILNKEEKKILDSSIINKYLKLASKVQIIRNIQNENSSLKNDVSCMSKES